MLPNYCHHHCLNHVFTFSPPSPSPGKAVPSLPEFLGSAVSRLNIKVIMILTMTTTTTTKTKTKTVILISTDSTRPLPAPTRPAHCQMEEQDCDGNTVGRLMRMTQGGWEYSGNFPFSGIRCMGASLNRIVLLALGRALFWLTWVIIMVDLVILVIIMIILVIIMIIL